MLIRKEVRRYKNVVCEDNVCETYRNQKEIYIERDAEMEMGQGPDVSFSENDYFVFTFIHLMEKNAYIKS